MTLAKCMASAFAVCVLSAAADAQPGGELKPDVAGVTLDAKGEVLRKVNLTLYPLDAGPAGDPLPPYSAISDRDGKFSFFGVAPGRYRLEAEHAGYLRIKLGARNTWAPGAILTVAAGHPLAGIEMRMPEQAIIAGTVAADESAAVVAVALLQPSYQDGQRRLTQLVTAQVDADGAFSLNKLAPGRYYLAAYGLPANSDATDKYVTTYYPGTIDAGAAEAIDLKKGQSLSGLQLPLRKSPVFRVSGSLAGYASIPGRVVVVLRPATASVGFNSGSSAVAIDGAFEFKSVLPGSYWIVAQVASPSLAVVPQAVEVASSDITGILLKAEPPVKLAGSVMVEGGPAAIPGLRIRPVPAIVMGQAPLVAIVMGQASLAAAGQPSLTADVKSDGSFTFTAPPGRYSFDFQGLPAEAFVKSAVLGDKDAAGGVELNQAAGESRLAIVISYAAARVTGVVRDDKDNPVNGVVTLIPEPPRPGEPSRYRVVATENGRFQIQGIIPGKYRLYAWEELEPGAHLDPQVTAPHQTDSVTIEVAENDRKEVELQRIPVE
jgi:hypothetical protein